MLYSQNNEQTILESYFGQYVGTLLSIGENNGEHLSNVLGLINNGWVGDVVEPSPQPFIELELCHAKNENVYCHNLAIGNKNAAVDFYNSGELLGIGDKGLVSSAIHSETKRWDSLKISFDKIKVQMVTFKIFMEDHAMFKTYDLISVDAEGMDITILRQMELDQLGCKCLVIEHNSLPANVSIIRDYTRAYGFKEIGYNQENIILAR
jgi:FkbM family methyltransferase